MNIEAWKRSIENETPAVEMSAPLAALWWDAKGDWRRAHALVDALESKEGMAVHAYLHRKEGDAGNAGYWYRRAGSAARQGPLETEWEALVKGLLAER